jgi:hypothetical protein
MRVMELLPEMGIKTRKWHVFKQFIALQGLFAKC